jgi:YfiH family protein
MHVLRSALLEGSHIAHGFFGRTGGVSKGIYASLNCGPGSGDDPADVVENRRRAAGALDGRAQLVTLYQVHGSGAVTVAEPWIAGEAPRADAMVTNNTNIALGILTADCVPVLLADRAADVVGAAHAGWKGAVAGVTDAAIAAMEALGAKRSRIAAAVGPCIGQDNYEVGPEFHSGFLRAEVGNDRYFAAGTRAGHYRFDLGAYVCDRLADSGISRVERLPACTYAQEAEFFSFRRATHRGESDYGRQLSAIMLRG